MTHAEVNAHYGRRGLLAVVVEAIEAAGLDPARLSPDDLAPLEEFHTLGRQATVGLAELCGLRPGTRVLDVGAGLGGPARLLAHRYGCQVVALDLTEEYCRVAEALTAMAGLEDRVEIRRGDALDLPFPEEAFDVVWSQHVSMNIADKDRLYREVHRVLAPGGRFAFFDVVAGENQPIHFPVPWAEGPSMSFLAPVEEMASLLRVAGFGSVVAWDDLTESVSAWFQAQAAASPASAVPRLGLHLLAPDLGRKLASQVRNIAERRVGFLRAVLVR